MGRLTPCWVTEVDYRCTIPLIELAQEQSSEMVGARSRYRLYAKHPHSFNRGSIVTYVDLT